MVRSLIYRFSIQTTVNRTHTYIMSTTLVKRFKKRFMLFLICTDRGSCQRNCFSLVKE